MAIFGQKDYQQLAIIKQLVRDLSYPIEIVGAPIVRADDGLALSSRNQYLSTTERKAAPILHQALQDLAEQLKSVQPNKQAFAALLADTRTRISDAGFIVDYLEVKTEALETVASDTATFNIDNQNVVILVAAWLGSARLLDNQTVVV